MTNKIEFSKSNENIKPVIYITPKGVVRVNSDFSVDEAAQAVIARINEHIKRIIEVKVAKERMTCKEELHRLDVENKHLQATQAELVIALRTLVDNGGIGPESMFHAARAALAKVEAAK